MKVRELLQILAKQTLENEDTMDYEVIVANGSVLCGKLVDIDEIAIDDETFVILSGKD